MRRLIDEYGLILVYVLCGIFVVFLLFGLFQEKFGSFGGIKEGTSLVMMQPAKQSHAPELLVGDCVISVGDIKYAKDMATSRDGFITVYQETGNLLMADGSIDTRNVGSGTLRYRAESKEHICTEKTIRIVIDARGGSL